MSRHSSRSHSVRQERPARAGRRRHGGFRGRFVAPCCSTPPLVLAALEIFHPQPDFNAQALAGRLDMVRRFHVIQLALTGLVALSVLLLAADFGRTTAWTMRLGIGVFLVFFSAYDTLAGIGTGLAMRSARDLSAAQQEGVFTVVKDWPGIRAALRAQHPRDPRVGRRRRHPRPGGPPPRSVATRVDRPCAGRCVPAGWTPIPVGDAGLRISLRRCALPRMETPVSKRGEHFRNSVLVILDSWGVALRRRTPWRELTPRQRQAMMVRGALQLGLLSAALNDLRTRPASQIRGPKALWVIVSLVNYLGIGPVAYFLFGRRRA